jgi:hypothetical protein
MKGRCMVSDCNGYHNTLLHFPKDSQLKVTFRVNANSSTALPDKSRVSLGVIAVRVTGSRKSCLTYALIDNGSDSTFIDESLALTLGLQGEETVIDLQTLGQVQRIGAKRVTFTVGSLDGDKRFEVKTALSVKDMSLGSGHIPTPDYLGNWSHLKDVVLNSIGNSRIELLIGCNVPEAHWVEEQRIGSGNQPFATRTALGWILLGPLSGIENNGSAVFRATCTTDIETKIETMYNTEFSDLDDSPAHSVDDQKALEFVQGSMKIVNNHLEIGLPWRANKALLQNNRSIAVRRLDGLEKRFTKDPQLFEEYKRVIQNHFDRGYAESIDRTVVLDSTTPRWYLPHHPVINPRKPGKIRVVFDGAAKFRGVCLNDCLLPGPNPVANLVAVLLRFREERIAIVSDVEEMFLQVKVPRIDREALRFLWWPGHDRSVPAEEFQLTVHPFGATSSPFCANAALKHCLELYQGAHRHAITDAIQNCFYVDDCLLSVESLDVAELMMRELRSSLSSVGFRLTKWMSNEASLLRMIPADELAKTVVDMTFTQLPTEKTLGLEWDAQTDEFKFTIALPDKPFTRRGMLSWVASLFDPLGMVCPVLLPTKLLLQDLNKQGYGWDQELSEDLIRRYRVCKASLPTLGSIRIPRCLKPINAVSTEHPELHLFSDASESGYGAVAYLRFLLQDGTYRCSFLLGKSRVAPTKIVSIPRLELNAAVLAVKIARFIHGSMRLCVSRTIFWTDSMTVIYYILNVKTRFTVFVANRLTFIREHSSVDQWHHVKSIDNAADCASRGLSTNDPRFDEWLRGPKFLEVGIQYNNERLQNLQTPKECEIRRVNFVRDEPSEMPLKNLLTRFSSWMRLLRAVVWLSRFKDYLRVLNCPSTDCRLRIGAVTVMELELATIDVVRLAQHATYGADLQGLSRLGEVKRTSPLRKLAPILSNGLIVIGGRLQNSALADSTMHPMILPNQHHVTCLLIQHVHEREGHTGVQQTLNTLRQNYWIIKGASVVKRVLRKCLICQRLHAGPGKQLMASLPSCRVTPGNYAFESTGVDYFGPLQVKQGRSMIKRWGCIFTCLRTRAVHIELAYSLTTDSFLMALMRFISRRGPPKEMFSDNGTNFVGADNELRQVVQRVPHQQVGDSLLNYDIQWQFQPPACSHRGGVWERLIRSVRRILSAISKEQVVTDESLTTFLAEVERIMNCRPIAPVSDDHTANMALTPNDILLLRPGRALIPEAILCLDQYRKHWKQALHLSNVFWKRWSREYLHLLQLRQKWQFKERNFEVGDVVLIASADCKRFEWPLARVTLTYPDSDGVVRKVDVKTSRGESTRDIRSLHLLEGIEAAELNRSRV